MERQWLFTQNPQDDKPIMLLNRQIGIVDEEVGIDGAAFQSELMFLDTLGKKRIKVYINSPGGSVIDGYSIFHSILSAKTPVDTYNIGIAASIAGIIFQAGHERVISDYANTMIHCPSGDEQKTLDKIQDSLISMLSSRNRKNLSEAKIKGDMEKETWYNSQESIDAGLADRIETSNDMNVPKMLPGENATAYFKKIQKIVNLVNEKPKPKIVQMKKVTNILNLNDDAQESSIVDAITKMKNEATDSATALADSHEEMTKCKAEFEKKMTDLQAKYDELNNTYGEEKKEKEKMEATNLLNKSTETVEGYVKEGRIKAEVKTEWVNKFVLDFDGTKKLVDTLPLNKPGMKIVDKTTSKIEGSPRTMGAAMLDIAAKNKQS